MMFAATAIAVASVPVTHGVAGHRLHAGASLPWKFRNIFFSGGKRFMVFQGFSWTFFAVAATCGLLALGSRFVPFSIDFDSPTLHEWSICSALISEVLMVASLLTYHRGSSNTHGRGHRRQPSTTTVEISNTGTTVIAALCCALAFAGAALLLAAKNSREAPAARLGFTVLALACFAIAVPVTHGVGGRLRWALGGGDAWSFWQPGTGGKRFVLLQAFGWACFSLSVAGCVVVAAVILRTSSAALIRGGGAAIGETGLKLLAIASWVAGGTGFAAQIITACSLLHFVPRGAGAPASPSSSPPSSPSKRAASMKMSSLREFATMLLVMHVIHAPHFIVIALITTVLATAPSFAWSATVLAIGAAAYAPTFYGAPGSTGYRSWIGFQHWMTRVVEDVARRWHGKCRVVRHGKEWRVRDDEDGEKRDGDSPRRVIFGYHPHGMLPAGACWFHHTPQFASLFPSIPSPVTLGANVIFRVPLLRDVVMWAGARNVSRKSFLRSLRERGAVVLCPGGQAELVEHVGGVDDHVVTLCTRHKGFIRIAIEEGAHLVPVFVFGESQAVRNIIKWKSAQRWTTKRLGFPMPFLPAGYKGFLPLPAPLPLSFVVGQPVEVPPPSPDGVAAEEDVARVCVEYYAKVEELFHRYKASSGFPHLELVLKHD